MSRHDSLVVWERDEAHPRVVMTRGWLALHVGGGKAHPRVVMTRGWLVSHVGGGQTQVGREEAHPRVMTTRGWLASRVGGGNPPTIQKDSWVVLETVLETPGWLVIRNQLVLVKNKEKERTWGSRCVCASSPTPRLPDPWS